MRLLVLGGTGFVGRSVVEAAVARGDDVTVLNRGQRPAIAGVTALVGDRRSPDGLAALGRDEWDVAVDTWAAEPYVVRDAARALADRVGRYAYVSSRSVYDFEAATADMDETGKVVDATPDDGEAGEKVEYAQAKRGGELAVEAVFGDRCLLARAGLILGPYEDIGRLPWWLNRIARGGDVLAPDPRGLRLQYIDARDLAIWMLDATAAGVGGAFNVVSEPGHTTMGELLDTCVQVTGSDARLRWTDPAVILDAGVAPWTELPIWLPPTSEYQFLHAGNVSRAIAAGLRCRPVTETVADTWAWLQRLGGVAPLRPDLPAPGLDPDVEARILAGPIRDQPVPGA
jgi:nucleoside-diphosphate-sugar epimerase